MRRPSASLQTYLLIPLEVLSAFSLLCVTDFTFQDLPLFGSSSLCSCTFTVSKRQFGGGGGSMGGGGMGGGGMGGGGMGGGGMVAVVDKAVVDKVEADKAPAVGPGRCYC